MFPETLLVHDGVVQNYSEQTLFEPPSWELNANFPVSDRWDDQELDLPADLSSVAANVGEIYLTRPACEGESVAGRTLKVYAYWKLGGAIVHSPTEGISIGADDGSWFEDATISYTTGEPDDQRPLNTANALVLEHTFGADDDIDPSTLVLRLWLLEEYVFTSTLYVNRVVWE